MFDTQIAFFYSIFLLFFISCTFEKKELPDLNTQKSADKIIYSLNADEIASGKKSIAIIGATLIDGNGDTPLENAMVVVKGNVIDYVGEAKEEIIPAEAEIFDAQGMTLLPGLIDAHYHGANPEMATTFLKKGVTTVRDPGAWISSYDSARSSGHAIPRLFLTGPHIDTYPPAYPDNSYLIKDPLEGRIAVNQFADRGATAIKVYFRLSTEMIAVISDAAHKRGIPVTAHLEITNAIDAIKVGLDGIEHVTSFGTALLPPQQEERYKNLIMADNAARERGRYEVWSTIEMENNRSVDTLIQFLVAHETFVCPTLAIFEKQFDKGDSVEVNGFGNMLKFIGRAKMAGVQIVVGSHTWVPYAETGNAYYREMELLKDAGLSIMEIIVAATMENARFFQIDSRLGSIEQGKTADLILLRENPLNDIKAMRSVEKVMLNGVFVDLEK